MMSILVCYFVYSVVYWQLAQALSTVVHWTSLQGVERAIHSHRPLGASKLYKHQHPISNTCLNMKNQQRNYCDWERRLFLKEVKASLIGITVSQANDLCCIPSANASEQKLTSENVISSIPSFSSISNNFGCLLNLSPVTPGCIRIYLCRHGQTENNRLHLVQGARVDPSINRNGYEQAQRLGLVVSRLAAEYRDDSSRANEIPTIVTHSKMIRARETAEVLTFVAKSSLRVTVPPLRICGETPELGEVDFGSLEGKEASSARMKMMSTFASWSIGDIDKRLPGGESGREVLERAVRALNCLCQLAKSSSTANIPTSVLAVTHSTFLRILLSMVNDSPLAESALWNVQNGSINIIDVNIKGIYRKIKSNSRIFKSGNWFGPLNIGIEKRIDFVMPEAYLIRKNEVGHLRDMVS